MAVALCLVVVRIIALSRHFRVLWGWDDVLVGFATVRQPQVFVHYDTKLTLPSS